MPAASRDVAGFDSQTEHDTKNKGFMSETITITVDANKAKAAIEAFENASDEAMSISDTCEHFIDACRHAFHERLKQRELAVQIQFGISEDERRWVLHALGISHGERLGWRNYFQAGQPEMFDGLVSRGIMRSIGDKTFRVTDSAIEQLKALGWEFVP